VSRSAHWARRPEQKCLDRYERSDRNRRPDDSAKVETNSPSHIQQDNHADRHAWRTNPAHRGAAMAANPKGEPRKYSDHRSCQNRSHPEPSGE
jgi:hypothetical protein